ncbi:hypothetical protein B0T14DRAFT_517686 [Immersiella caudata]|uniref:Uncharacterized protein n=1 Tax=Immersiella caudata TaxID=314043 RepID=A0AA39WYY2_9PEZI|nr:hypothetical protein B0T14DRAFT_517686 [Immersiella caudata]
MQFSALLTLAITSIFTLTAANPIEIEPRGGVPCSPSEPCPPQWPKCIKFPSSCQSNCAGICV